MDVHRMKTNFALVCCVLFVLIGLVMAFMPGDATMAWVVVLFFGACAAILIVMRQEETAPVEPGNAPLPLAFARMGRTSKQLTVLVVACLAFVGAGVLMVMRGEDPILGWMGIAFGATCALTFAAQRVDQAHRDEALAHGGLVVDPDRARRWARLRLVVMGFACLGFAVMFVMILREGGADWIAWPGLVFFGLGAIALLVRAALGKLPETLDAPRDRPRP